MYTESKYDENYGIMYHCDPACYPEFKYYQSSDKRNEMFAMILTTGQLFCEQKGIMVKPYKLCMIEKNEKVYTQPV